MTPLLPAAGMVSLLSCLGALVLMRAIRRQERLTARLRSIGRSDTPPAAARPGRNTLLRVVGAAGTAIARSGLLSTGTLLQLEQTLLSAGLRGGNGLGVFVGSKLLLLLGLPATAWFVANGLLASPLLRNAAVAGAAVIGLLLPDYIVRSRRRAYLAEVQAGLADALDMMVICSEAGLGLEPAITRVAAEISHAHPAIATELSHLASDLRVAADRRTALLGMGVRTGLDSLKRLGATLVQTLQYGTPLSQALRILSAEMRGETLVRFESRAARLPVLLTLPMIVFILPTVFIVVGGPAILSVLASLHH